jgi:hypothetical protein
MKRHPDSWFDVQEREEGKSLNRQFRVVGKGMCSPMLTAHSAPTGVSLIHGGCTEICSPVHEEYEAEFNPLHMNWVLVDDTKGNHRAQMRWAVDR